MSALSPQERGEAASAIVSLLERVAAERGLQPEQVVDVTAYVLGHLCLAWARPGHLGPLVETACVAVRAAAGTTTPGDVERDLASVNHVH